MVFVRALARQQCFKFCEKRHDDRMQRRLRELPVTLSPSRPRHFCPMRHPCTELSVVELRVVPLPKRSTFCAVFRWIRNGKRNGTSSELPHASLFVLFPFFFAVSFSVPFFSEGKYGTEFGAHGVSVISSSYIGLRPPSTHFSRFVLNYRIAGKSPYRLCHHLHFCFQHAT